MIFGQEHKHIYNKNNDKNKRKGAALYAAKGKKE